MPKPTLLEKQTCKERTILSCRFVKCCLVINCQFGKVAVLLPAAYLILIERLKLEFIFVHSIVPKVLKCYTRFILYVVKDSTMSILK